MGNARRERKWGPEMLLTGLFSGCEHIFAGAWDAAQGTGDASMTAERVRQYSEQVFPDISSGVVRDVVATLCGTRREIRSATKRLKLSEVDHNTVAMLVLVSFAALCGDSVGRMRCLNLLRELTVYVVAVDTLRMLLMVLALELVRGEMDTRTVLVLLCEARGCDTMLSVLRCDLNARSRLHGEVVACVLAVMCTVFRPGPLLASLRGLAASENEREAVLAMQTTACLPDMLGAGLLPYMSFFCDIVRSALNANNRTLQAAAAFAAAALGDCPGAPGLGDILALYKVLASHMAKALDADKYASLHWRQRELSFLKAMAHLSHNSQQAAEVLGLLTHVPLRDRYALSVYLHVVDCVGTLAGRHRAEEALARRLDEIVTSTALPRIAENVFAKQCGDRMGPLLLCFLNKESVAQENCCRLFGAMERLVLQGQEIESYYAGVLSFLRKAHANVPRNVSRLLIREFMREEDTRCIHVFGAEAARHPDAGRRALGFKVLVAVQPYLEKEEKERCWEGMVEGICERESSVLRVVLKGLASVDYYRTGELFYHLVPLLQRREELPAALMFAERVLGEASTGKHIEREWLRICNELVDCLGAARGAARTQCAECLALVAKNIGMQHVLDVLIEGLNSTHRPHRSGCIQAIGAIGRSCGLSETFFPLICDYSVPSAQLRCGILQALAAALRSARFCPPGCIYMLLPLAEDALTEPDVAYRALGMRLVQHIAMCSHTNPCVPVLVHLLNFVFPNVLEKERSIRNEFDQCIEALCSVLGGHYLYKYVVQGLYHPAQRVRRRYWEVRCIVERHNPSLFDTCIGEEARILESLPPLSDTQKLNSA